MRPTFTRGRRARAILAAAALATALPASTMGASAHPNPSTSYLAIAVTAPDGSYAIPLINSGDVFDGTTFAGIPDGLGLKPVGNGQRYVDIYVAFEQSHVPFSGFADYEDSSVQRARLDLKTNQIVELEEVVPASAGFIRFCSATMVGPAEGFSDYTFLVNEESNDVLPVTPGAPGADPALSPYRQAGLSVWLDTKTGDYRAIPGLGRHNHENTVVVPGGWGQVAVLSGDDTFSAPSSQLYLYLANSLGALKQDKGSLWAFQVTGVDGAPMTEAQIANPFNDLNDYLELSAGHNYQGRFIEVPRGIATGADDYPDGSGAGPQASLENWSNAHNVFQFVRIEDLGYDPDDPQTVYFADTGSSRINETDSTGRLFRPADAPANKPWINSNGRIFKMEMNASDPTAVDSLSILGEGSLTRSNADGTTTTLVSGVGLVNPDNVGVGHASLMVQEDASSANDVWRYDFGAGTWTKVANTIAAQTGSAETSGIVDASSWLGAGWWVLTVQSHITQETFSTGNSYTVPITGATISPYTIRREAGQLVLLFVPGS